MEVQIMCAYTPKEWVKNNLVTNKKLKSLDTRVTALEDDGGVTVDTELSTTSENPVQNKVIAQKINTVEASLNETIGRVDNIPVITVDSVLSTSSENPVQNKVVTNAINAIQKIYTADSYLTYDTLIQMGEDFNNNVTVVLYYDDLKLTLCDVFTSGGTTKYTFIAYGATEGSNGSLSKSYEWAYIFSKPENSSGDIYAQLAIFDTTKYEDYAIEITSIDNNTTVPTFKTGTNYVALTLSIARASYFNNLNQFIKYDGYFYKLIDLDLQTFSTSTFWYKAEKYENNGGTLTKHERLLVLKFATNGPITGSEHYVIS